MKKLYLQLNEPGSGEITLPLDTAQAANLSAGGWVPLDYKGTVLGGFWAESFERVNINAQEKGGRTLRVSGRGALAILDDAIVWDWQTPDLTNVRRFWVKLMPISDPAMTNKGYILWQLLYEARDHIALNRHCWHDALDNHLLIWNFTQTADSDGIDWDAAEVEYLESRTGVSLLDLARQYAVLGQPTAGYAFDIEAVHDDATGVTEFKIHQTPIGVSAINAKTHFRLGVDCTEVSNVESRADIRNSVLLQYAGGGCPYVQKDDTPSIIAYRRRELFLNAANASTDTEGDTFANAQLKTSKDPLLSISLKISDANGPKYGTDYHLGDWIYYDDGTGVEVPYRIVGIQLEWDDNWFADVVVTLNSEYMENEIRSARDLRKVGAQASGSNLLNVSTNENVVAGALVHPPSDGAAKGQVLTADGLGLSDWLDVDGGVGFSSGVQHILSELHLQDSLNDEITRSWSLVGLSPTLDAVVKKWGAGSGKFLATQGWTASVSAIGSTDLCVDCWIHPNGSGGILFRWGSGTGMYQIELDGAYCVILHLGLWDRMTTAMALTPGVWNHLAVTRYSGVNYVFINGFLDTVNFAWGGGITDANVTWGNPAGATGVNCNICEATIWDYAKYTVPFIPETAPYVLNGHTLRGTVIEFRRGNAANLPPLFPGEPYIELDTGILHMGDSFTYGAGAAPVANLGSTPEVIGAAKDDGVATSASRSDHKHAVTNPKIDSLVAADDNTNLDATTSHHGLIVKPVAPAAGLTTIPAIENGETVWKNKAIFDTTNPEAPGAASPGTQLIAARRDHVHPAGAGGGDVTGPAGATDGHVALFDGATGKAIKDGGALAGGGNVSDTGATTANHLAVWNGASDHIIKDGGVVPTSTIDYLCQGRLTLESGVPISSSAQANKTTLYFTPYKGNLLYIYDGVSAWVAFHFSELSLNISAFTASKPYDIFVYDNGGTPTLEGLVWTNATTRATALALQDGVYVKSGVTSRRYLGTIYMDAASKCQDTVLLRYLWNYYNRVMKPLYIENESSHTYATGTWRSWNNDAALRIQLILGLIEDPIWLSIQGQSKVTAGNVVYVAAMYDATNNYLDPSLAVGHSTDQVVRAASPYLHYAGIGFHYYQAVELGGPGGNFIEMALQAYVMG